MFTLYSSIPQRAPVPVLSLKTTHDAVRRVFPFGNSPTSASSYSPTPRSATPTQAHSSSRCPARYKCGVCGSAHVEKISYISHLKIHALPRNQVGKARPSPFL